MYKALNNSGEWDIEAMEDPIKRFPNSYIIQVQSLGDNNENDFPEVFPIDSLEVRSGIRNVKSGTKIIFKDLNTQSYPFWIYIPFNIESSDRFKEFKRLLSKNRLDYSKLENDPDEFIIDHHKALTTITNKL
ncbi:MAG: hypothetical protein K2G52_03690 [Muribaculaceae bacterium]|nr:hypothetical protein [Muribaculaceae bacterium]